MMSFGSMGGAGMYFGLLLLAILVGLVIWGIYTLAITQREIENLTAFEILERRYAHREISQAEYEQAVEDMVARTSHEPHARWHLIPAESKRYARVAVIDTVIEEVEAGMRRHGIEPPPPIDG